LPAGLNLIAPIVSEVPVEERSSIGQADLSKPWLYPNPATSDLFIKSPKGVLGTFTITDLNGQSMYSQKISGLEAPTRISISLPDGFYIAKIQYEDGSLLIDKIIIQHK
jgi:Secretion system C-terminal sorting domain